jgi:uncharacterized protein YjbJ (UPF0337 family)
MGDRKQRIKGNLNEAAGKAKAATGRGTGNRAMEAKGTAKAVKGKTQQTVGKARSAAKKASR